MPSNTPEERRPTLSNIPSLVCAFCASATTGGTSYAFGLYSSALKKSLHLSQSQLDSISTAFFVAGLFSWIPGLCSDRFGTKVALSMGGVSGASTLMMYWAVARKFIEVDHSLLVVTLSVLGILIFLSCAMVTGAVFKIIVATTGPGTKGSAVGVAKGYVGLGAGLYACIFESFRNTNESELDFLPMAAFFFLACSTLPTLIMMPSKQMFESCQIEDESTSRHYQTLYISLIGMAILIVASSMVDLYDNAQLERLYNSTVTTVETLQGRSQPANGSEYGRGILLVTVWLAPIYFLQVLPRKQAAHGDGVILVDHDDDEVEADLELSSNTLAGPVANSNLTDDREEERLLTSTQDESEHDGSVAIVSTAEQETNMNLVQMLQTPSALFMLWTTTILVGAGTVETNNMGQMVESLGFPGAVTSASLALFSVAQAAARVITGSLSEAALNWNTKRFCTDNGVPRPFFLVVASIVGVVAHFLLALATSEFVFVIGATLSGAAFGMVWPLMVLITGEVFGTANVGANYMFFDGFTSAAGTLLLTKIIAQDVYESHIDPHSSDATTCYGLGCFQNTHLAAAGLSVTCIFSSLLMLYCSRHVYNKPNLHTAQN